MRSLLVLPTVLLGAALLSPAQQQAPTPVEAAPAENPSAPAPIKIATIFAQNAIISTQEGQKATAALNAKFAPQKDEFDRKQANLLQLRDQLKKNQATLTPDAKARLNDTIDQRTRELQRLGQDSQNALQEDEGAMLQELGEKMVAVIQEYSEHNGYAVVIDVSVPQGPVLWAAPSVDITSEIVKLYDQAHPVAAPAPKPATAAAPVKK